MQDQILQEILHLNLDVQCYMGGKFAGAVYFYHFFYQEVDREAWQHSQLAIARKQNVQDLPKGIITDVISKQEELHYL